MPLASAREVKVILKGDPSLRLVERIITEYGELSAEQLIQITYSRQVATLPKTNRDIRKAEPTGGNITKVKPSAAILRKKQSISDLAKKVGLIK